MDFFYLYMDKLPNKNDKERYLVHAFQIATCAGMNPYRHRQLVKYPFCKFVSKTVNFTAEVEHKFTH